MLGMEGKKMPLCAQQHTTSRRSQSIVPYWDSQCLFGGVVGGWKALGSLQFVLRSLKGTTVTTVAC